MALAGSKPGKGIYICKKCGQEFYLDRDDDILPKCPLCGCDDFIP